jgi:eukaryotic-like serine/threonine-protein kinase
LFVRELTLTLDRSPRQRALAAVAVSARDSVGPVYLLPMLHVCPECGVRHEAPGVCTADGTTLVAAGDPLLGETIGRWRITSLLGAGGMGRVYRAVQPEIGSRVAVKVLSNELVHNQEAVDRFFAEARAVNLIRHEQIVDVLDLARLPDGRPYIVMEYLDGEPLSSTIAKRGQLPLGTLVELTHQILDALGAAHAKGIIHRDLKPDNIYISPAGHTKVLDFGIAKLEPTQRPGVEGTRVGAIMGTPHYMSPEQALGRTIDARADLYSMGIILFEASTGRRPFDADSMFELLRQHIDVPPPSPRLLRPDMPAAYEQVILKALAKDPAQRFARADEMADALVAASATLPPEAWQALRITSATPVVGSPSSLSRARSTARAPARRGWPVAFAAIFGVAALAAAVVAVLMTGNKPPEPPPQPPPTPTPLAETRVPDAAVARPAEPTPVPKTLPTKVATSRPHVPSTPSAPTPTPPPTSPPVANPVRISGMHTNQGWVVTLFVVPRPLEIFVKLPHAADWKSLGKNEQAFDAENNPLPNTYFPLDDDQATGPIVIGVKYKDQAGAMQGPVQVTFDPRAQRLAESRHILQLIHWIAFRWYDQKMLVYFTALRAHRDVLRHVRYGIDAAPTKELDAAVDYFTVPPGSQYMTVELEFIDGGRSEVKKLNVPAPPANPAEDKYYE